MVSRKQLPPKTQRKFGTIWGEVHYVCRRIHHWLYVRNSPSTAKRYLSRLEGLLKKLPENDLAIVREEALALLYELKGQKHDAMRHRKREIELTERLHRSVRNSVKDGDYDETTAATILSGRDDTALAERQAILRLLQKQDLPESQNGMRSRGQGNGVSKKPKHLI